MYKIILYKDAVKFYGKMAETLRRKINVAIDSIAKNPYHNIHIKKLRGELSHMYRYRVGDTRILYEIHEEIKYLTSIRSLINCANDQSVHSC